MTSKTHNMIVAGLVGFGGFLLCTAIEVALTIWAFKKFGGCPIVDKHKKA